MARKIITAVLIMGLFLVQSAFIHLIPISNCVPNLLLMLTVCFGFMCGKKTGLWIGFFCGLVMDLYSGSLFGFHALLYMYSGYMNGLLYNVFFDDDIRIPLVLVAITDFAYNLVYYVIQFAFRMRFEFVQYLKHIIIPEVVYTVICTLILYKILYAINKKLVKNELEGQRSPWLRK